MNPINININVDDDLIKKFILDISQTIYNKNNEYVKHSISYVKAPNIELLTVKEVSKALKTDEPTIRGLIDKGYLKALKLGRLKIRNTEIERFLDWAEGKDLSDLNNIKSINNH